MVGLANCGSLFTHVKTKKMTAGEYLARHSRSIRQSLKAGDLDNAYWLPGTENPADGWTKVRRGMASLLRLLEPGHFNPGSSRTLKGVARKGRGDCGKHRHWELACAREVGMRMADWRTCR